MDPSPIRPVLHVFARNLDYARRLVADIPESDLAAQPAPGMNHPAWVLGHLANTLDTTATLLGLPRACPDDWPARFGRDSTPEADASAYPDKAALLAALESNHARVAEALEGVSAEDLGREMPLERFRATFPTVGDAVVFMTTAHESIHLGQLSAWRRVRGLPPA